MTIAKDGAFQRALRRYTNAAIEKAFEGTIPYLSDDAEEQALIDAAYREVNEERQRATQLLVDLIDRRIGAGQKVASEEPKAEGVAYVLSAEELHAYEDAAARRALEYAARRIEDLAKRLTDFRGKDASGLLRTMKDGVWRFRKDSQPKDQANG